MSWNAYDFNSGGAMPFWGGGNTGTGFGGALGGGLVGGLIGGALFNGGLFGNGNNSAKDVAVETSKQVGDLQGSLFASSLAAADRGYQQTIAFNQQMNGVDRDVLTTGYDTSRQMCDGFYAGNTTALQNKYDNAIQLSALGYAQEKCCCDTNMNITKMGYETQLRDQGQFGALMNQLTEVKCLIKDTEAASFARAQAQKICDLESRLNKEEIIAAMKPVAPVPAYIQANPYENFRPVVRVEHERRDFDCDCRWGFNNCHRGGFQ